MSRRSPCTRADAKALVAKAEAFLKAARRAQVEGTTADSQVATATAVDAAIAASDAICCMLLRERSRSPNHGDAVKVLASVRRGNDTAWSRGLADALGHALAAKDDSHYGVAGIAVDAEKRAMRAAERLIAAARETLSEP